MQKQVLFLSKIVTVGVAALFQQSAFAELLLTQDTWQQPYPPTRLQWLFINLPGGKGELTSCGILSQDNVPIAFYQWESPSANDNQLILSVITRPPAVDAVVPEGDRNYCTFKAFEDLQLESSRIGASPPPVELRHFRVGSEGRILVGSYQCSVPATGMNRFESLCR